ncbi:hypothetical protein J3R30DRAFT_3303206 [Lentinula aciculospora]|uniref:F-box domain-containing protein n=1 Tax=Lentinula aciculospora TaxID=153920 RepID=A0A9W8ZYU0_9AGAR|nr:hypothetical protein J3R30DRAFT_3303206 [Lentinula aciculospora]
MPLGPVVYRPPISLLPIEVLSYIFVLGAHSQDCGLLGLPPVNAESVKTPLTYSAVCRHWRAVALGTAALWTSICITAGSMEIAGPDQEKQFNLSHITSYLSLSRKYPLNILFDARDIDWDFAEPEISNSSDYVPPFAKDDIQTIFSLLLPHLSRWRSIDILTDTWAPMHTALCMLNKQLMTNGAPLLESLTLMRCNDYISHSPLFQPSRMKAPELFSSQDSIEPNNLPLLPLLRNITLRGVHVNWSSLAHSQPALTSLELSSHSFDVRPTLSEFRDLLSSCPKLKSLIVNSSGFISDDEDLSLKTGVHNIHKIVKPVSFPLLEELKIGYRSALEGCAILGLIHATNTRLLSLEDATHPGEIDEIEADEILLFIAGFRSPSVALKTSCPAFPATQTLVLKGLRAQIDAIRKLLVSMPNLQSVELHQIHRPMDAIRAMLPNTFSPSPRTTYQRLLSSRPASPSFSPSSFSTSSPCPRLRELCIWAIDLSREDLRFIAKDLLSGRLEAGAASLRRLDIHLFDSPEPASEDLEESGMRIFKDSLDTEDDDSDISIGDNTPDVQLDEEFQFGGIFNDPIFDAQYSPSTVSR